MRVDAGPFVTEAVDRIKNKHGLTTDQDVINLLPRKKNKKGKLVPLIHLSTLRKWKAGMQAPELKKLDTLLKLVDPTLDVGQCLSFPDRSGFLRKMQAEMLRIQQQIEQSEVKEPRQRRH